MEPPEELWTLLDELYSLHAMLMRINRPEFIEAANRMERAIVDLQAAFTAPRKAAS